MPQFLNKAVQGESIEKILKDVYKPKMFEDFIHAQSNFPQILYPRGFELFPAPVSDYVKGIGKILLRKF